ncbi:unnamed protein product, partial [Allacma fusca]
GIFWFTIGCTLTFLKTHGKAVWGGNSRPCLQF